MKRYKLRMVIFFLIICIAVASTGFSGSGSTRNISYTEATKAEKPFILPDIVEEEEALTYGYVDRIKDAEDNLNTFIFYNKDGSNTMRIYNHPVKYIDSAGNIQDITLNIKQHQNGGYVTADNTIITTFPENLSEGITLMHNNLTITMIPVDISNDIVPVLSEDNKRVAYIGDNRTVYEYSLTYTGFKEDIIVKEYTGRTEYSFLLQTNGLSLVRENESYYLKNEEGQKKAIIGDIVIFSADQCNNTFGNITHETIQENQKYILTIHIDDEYLRSPETAYPIRIDPTIEINDITGAIEDTTINSNSGSDGSSGSLYAGKRENYGISRILMKFPGMNLSSIFNSDQIIKATVELRDLMCESIEIPLYCYVYTGGYWTESTASWSNVNPNGYSTYLDHNTISYANGEKISHRYQFDITNAVKSWKAGSISNNGIIFKTTASVENGDVYTTKTFASFNRASYKPTCTVVYSNPFYSLYSTTYQKYSNASLTADDNLQYRANCYGYALRMFCAVSGNYTYYNAYKQQPGEFVFKGNGGLNLYRHGQYSFTITDWEDLVMVYNEIFSAENSAASIKLNFVYDLMVADMNELGYTITQTTASSLENDPNTSTRRLCALVVGDYDYHFYIQHSNGVWSHKPGQSVPSNKCLDCQLPLTNANFAEHALEGGYTKGIRYFYVTKSAVIDYGNLNGHYDSCKGTSVYSPDGAGNTFIPAKVLPPSVTLAGRIDYKGDADFYAINIASPGTRTITVTTTSVDTTPDPYPISISVYLPTAMFVKSASSTTGTATLTNQFSKGIYYIQITSSGQSAYEYGRRYNIRFE